MLLCSKFPHTFHTQYKEFFHKYAARFVSVVLLRDRFQYTDHSQYIYFPYNSVYFSFSMSPGCDTICTANYIPVKIQLSVFPVRHAEKSSVSDLPVIFASFYRLPLCTLNYLILHFRSQCMEICTVSTHSYYNIFMCFRIFLCL